jgi:hypothetical protein
VSSNPKTPHDSDKKTSEKMIRLQMSGRLGNQLFQWAYCHRLAEEFNTKVELTYDTFNYPSLVQVITKPDCCPNISTQKNQLIGLATTIVDKYDLSTNSSVVRWLYSQLDPYTLPSHLTQPKVLRGYFTASATTSGFENHLMDSLNPWISSMLSENSISVHLAKHFPSFQVMHVRRGDFLEHKESIGVLAPSYYEQVRNWSEPLIIVTDSNSEIPELNAIVKPDLTLHQQNSSIFDSLNLMRSAASLVLSNSTFSWWGGFLASFNSATIYCPEPFFKRDELVKQAFIRKEFRPIQSYFY